MKEHTLYPFFITSIVKTASLFTTTHHSGLIILKAFSVSEPDKSPGQTALFGLALSAKTSVKQRSARLRRHRVTVKGESGEFGALVTISAAHVLRLFCGRVPVTPWPGGGSRLPRAVWKGRRGGGHQKAPEGSSTLLYSLHATLSHVSSLSDSRR